MNVNTGEVLAMASYPEYNPADFVGGISNENWAKYRDNEAKPLVNKAIQNSYSPGSTFKMITAIAGLESGVINLNTKINDTGIYTKYSDYQPKCWYYTDYHRGHGYLDVSGAIEKSCNYFFYETADKMGIDTLVKFAKYFGLGTKTGIDFPNEQTGMKGTKVAGDLLLNFAIGQYDTYTPISLLQYINTIANYGNRYALRLKKDDYNSFMGQVDLDSTYFDRITTGLYQVFHGGTASSYISKNLNAVGKTGTSETFYDSDKDGVVDVEVINSTLAYYFPREKPTYSVVIIAPYLTNSPSYTYPFTKNVSLKISNYLTSQQKRVK